MKLINIGFDNIINADRLVTIVSPDSAPIKRVVQESKEKGLLVDATYGRRTRAVLIMNSGHVILTYLQAKMVINRLDGQVETSKEGVVNDE